MLDRELRVETIVQNNTHTMQEKAFELQGLDDAYQLHFSQGCFHTYHIKSTFRLPATQLHCVQSPSKGHAIFSPVGLDF